MPAFVLPRDNGDLMIFRFLWFLLLGFLFFKLIQTLWRTIPRAPRQADEKPAAKGEKMVKDPQCGTYVPESEALKATRAGKTYFFCSPECRDRFLSAKK
jgi:YHS domain-containing protein